MTEKQARKLIKDLANSYLSFGRELTDIQEGTLLNLFLSWDFSRACRALTMLDRDMPPIKTEGYLPESKDIEKFYDRAGNHGYSKLPPCPCCSGERKKLVKARECEYMTVCDCVPEEEAIKIIKDQNYWTQLEILAQEYFRNHSEIKCVAFDCNHTEDIPCPRGRQWHNAKKIEFMHRIKQDPAYQAGLKLLKKDGFVKAVLSSLDDMPAGEERE